MSPTQKSINLCVGSMRKTCHFGIQEEGDPGPGVRGVAETPASRSVAARRGPSRPAPAGSEARSPAAKGTPDTAGELTRAHRPSATRLLKLQPLACFCVCLCFFCFGGGFF